MSTNEYSIFVVGIFNHSKKWTSGLNNNASLNGLGSWGTGIKTDEVKKRAVKK